jgi:hypothetical protein
MSKKAKEIFVVLALATVLSSCNTRDALLITGGAIGGAILTKTLREDPPPRHQPPATAYYPPPLTCYDYIDGEWRKNEHGKKYWHQFRHPKEITVPCR